MIRVHIVPILSDNYTYILQHGDDVAVVDPGDDVAVIHALKERNLEARSIFITHHHSDHTAGILALKAAFGCTVYGARADERLIPGLDHTLADSDTVTLGDEKGLVIATPGHTRGHISYWFEKSNLLFSGDTLFSLGCGRLMDGTAQEMFASLGRLMDLPDDTQLYCGHEYTQANAAFAASLIPDDPALALKMDTIKKLRANDLPTVPATLGEEKRLNPFLQCKNAEEFATLRRLKDQF